MSIIHKTFLANILLVGCIAGAFELPKADAAVELTRARAAQDIIKLTNRERIQRNLPPLRVDRHCVSAITSHVNDMARGRFLSHEGRDGRGASERYRQYHTASRGAGENIAYNMYGTGASFMRQWLRSPAHRGNILSPIYKGIGVSIQATCSARGAGRRCYYYAGQCFSP